MYVCEFFLQCKYVFKFEVVFHSFYANFAQWFSWNVHLKVATWCKLLACNFCMDHFDSSFFGETKIRWSPVQYSTKVLWCRRALAILSKKLFPCGLCQQCVGPHCSSHTWPKVAAMGTSSRWKAAASSFQADLAAIPDLPVFHSLSVCQLYVVLTSSHRRNVHPERWMSLSDGQHQWGFDVDLGPSGSLTSLDMLRLFDLHWCTTVQDM